MRLQWCELKHGTVALQCQDQQVASVLGALSIDAKGLFDAVLFSSESDVLSTSESSWSSVNRCESVRRGVLSRSESAGLSMSDTRTADEVLALRESLTRSPRKLRLAAQ